jgi:hypothetical protein
MSGATGGVQQFKWAVENAAHLAECLYPAAGAMQPPVAKVLGSNPAPGVS